MCVYTRCVHIYIYGQVGYYEIFPLRKSGKASENRLPREVASLEVLKKCGTWY